MGKAAGAALLRRRREVRRLHLGGGGGGVVEAAPKYTRQMWAAPIAVHRQHCNISFSVLFSPCRLFQRDDESEARKMGRD